MIKTLTFGDKDIQISTSLMWSVYYKAQFGEDPAKSIVPTVAKITAYNLTESDMVAAFMEEIGITGTLQITWAMAKAADRQILPFDAWVEKYGDDIEITDLMLDVIPDVITACFSSKKYTAPEDVGTEPETKTN